MMMSPRAESLHELSSWQIFIVRVPHDASLRCRNFISCVSRCVRQSRNGATASRAMALEMSDACANIFFSRGVRGLDGRSGVFGCFSDSMGKTETMMTSMNGR